MTTPTKPTYTETIRAHLLAGNSISTWQAYEQYHITCLAQRIHDLRNDGLPINSELVTQDGKRFSLYWLSTDYLNARLDSSHFDKEGA